MRGAAKLMRRLSIFAILLFCALVGGARIQNGVHADKKPRIRQPAVAGSFYPADPEQLTRMVDDFVAKAVVPANPGRVVALVASHAGYEYSGAVAAHSFALLKGQKFARVIVIAPSHFDGFAFNSVYDGDAYSTPLGTVPVDREFAAKLAKGSPLIQLSSRGHTPDGPQGEHAIEVQLPFLQRVLGDFKLVPIVMGYQDYRTERALGVALAKLIKGGDTLIVASSDLSHYHTYDEANRIDHKTLKAIEQYDYVSLSQNFESNVWEACGGGPIVAAMIAAERLGANQAKLLKYANTGDVTGDHSRVVGYSAVALLQAPAGTGGAERFSLNAKEKDTLLRLARESVETAVKEKSPYEPPTPDSESLQQERGVFVTLKEKGDLRGCIGFITARKPLYLAVRDTAALAAVRDPRFSPVNQSELPELEYEISVLTPFRHVADTKEIRIGRDGLLMIHDDAEGVFLPQVPVEERWDRRTYLEELGVKAGLDRAAWQDDATDIFAFSALVFGDHKLPEPITPEMSPPQRSRSQPGSPGPDSQRP
jgi:AmmeMemoRadiSam system protein B/AmmeMemoRadiSam system protein A